MSYYQGLQAEMVAFRAHNGDKGEAYYARPSRAGKFPGIVIIHHLPGWDEWIIEVARKFAHHGLSRDRSASLFPRRPGKPRRYRRACASCGRGGRRIRCG